MRAFLVALSFALSSCASVEGAPPAAPAAQAAEETDYPVAVDVPSGTYRLDPRHASVVFRIRHMDLGWVVVRFNDKDAALELDAGDPARSRLTASVAADSVDTGLPEGGPAFDRQIARALGAESTPRITFVSTGVRRTGRFTATITGDLTLNGQTHPATLDAIFHGGRVDPLRGGAMVLAFSAHGVIDRSQWGVSAWRAFASDNVEIVIDAELVKT